MAKKRGRKPKGPGQKMDAPVMVRLTPAQRQQVTRAAKAAGFSSVAAYLRSQANLTAAEGMAGASKD